MGALARADRTASRRPGATCPSGPATGICASPRSASPCARPDGGTGQRFNLGEMTVARATVRIDQGLVGFGYVAGRDLRHAELAALFDALLQDDAHRPMLLAALIEPLERAAATQRAARSQAVQASKVEFFTMVRSRE
ncbi:MAG: phosphonate C-P lyase system protein PhnG [Pseudomonadota bacterium]